MRKIFLLLVIMIAGVSFSASAQILKKSVPKNVFEQKIFDICAEVASTMSKKDSTKIAISEFYTLEGERSPYSRFINEAVTIELFKTKKFKILEKGRIEKVLKEQKMELNGQSDGDVAKKLGKILDVKAILAGTIIDMGNTLRVNARLIDTGTGIIVAASTVEIEKNMVIPSYTSSDVIDETSDVEENPQNHGIGRSVDAPNITAKIKSVKAQGKTLVYEISFTNSGDDDEMDFASAVVPGYATELISSGKNFPVEAIIAMEGTTLSYVGKIQIGAKETKTVIFKFTNASSELSKPKLVRVLARLRNLSASIVITLE